MDTRLVLCEARWRIYISEVWGSECALVAVPRNREIGFVSSSFSFRVVRASGRGEAVRARVGGDPPRWASWVIVSRWPWPLGAHFLYAGMWFLRDLAHLLKSRGACFMRRHDPQRQTSVGAALNVSGTSRAGCHSPRGIPPLPPSPPKPPYHPQGGWLFARFAASTNYQKPLEPARLPANH